MVITWDFHSRNSGSSPDIGNRRRGGEDTAHGAFVSIAQTVERATVNRKATGSIPVRNAWGGDSWDSSDGRA